MNPMDDSAAGDAMIRYLKTKVLRNAKVEISASTPLVSSGLIDSLMLVDVLSELERVTGRRIPAGRVSPADLDTVTKMLALAATMGRPSG
jgi:acyl carrier protein